MIITRYDNMWPMPRSWFSHLHNRPKSKRPCEHPYIVGTPTGKEWAQEAEDMPVLTKYFNVCYTGVHATQAYCFCAETAKVPENIHFRNNMKRFALPISTIDICIPMILGPKFGLKWRFSFHGANFPWPKIICCRTGILTYTDYSTAQWHCIPLHYRAKKRGWREE